MFPLLLKDGRFVKGKLVGYDSYMNIVIDDAQESDGESLKRLGKIVLRGNGVISISQPWWSGYSVMKDKRFLKYWYRFLLEHQSGDWTVSRVIYQACPLRSEKDIGTGVRYGAFSREFAWIRVSCDGIWHQSRAYAKKRIGDAGLQNMAKAMMGDMRSARLIKNLMPLSTR